MQLVDDAVTLADGRELHYVSAGNGTRLVVFEAGLGMGAHYWIPTLGALTQVENVRGVAYNRSGIGASTADTQPRTLSRLADDLRALIAAQEYDSLVIVGHSWGGPISRVAATTPIRGLSGIVLVDPSDEHLLPSFNSLSIGMQRVSIVPLARLHLLAKVYSIALKGFQPDIADRVIRETTSVSAAREAAAELKEFLHGLRSLDASKEKTCAATTIITGASTMPGESVKIRAKIRKAHHEASLKLGAELLVAEHSGHSVPITEPDLVAAAALTHFG